MLRIIYLYSSEYKFKSNKIVKKIFCGKLIRGKIFYYMKTSQIWDETSFDRFEQFENGVVQRENVKNTGGDCGGEVV